MPTQLEASTIHQTTQASFDNTASFPEVVQRLAAIGVERYHVDLTRWEKTCYGGDGASARETFPGAAPAPVGAAFSQSEVRAAIQASQRKEIAYPEFLREILAAGVTDYSVYIEGRRAIYRGRRGEFHIEEFPRGDSD